MSQGGFDKVLKMIDEMVAVLKTEQEDDNHKKEYCLKQFDLADDKQKELERNIADHENAIATAKETIATLAEEIAALEAGIKALDKEETVTTLEKEPILECTHKNTEQCHYTYVTQFKPSQEEVCEENFEKLCSITFKQKAFNETVKECYRPVEKVCNGQGPEECRTVYESSCTTKYVEKQPGKFVGDTACEKLPVEICGAGCTYEEGPQECHDKVTATLVDVPEEVCDLNPQKTCRFVTNLVPKLSPKHECTIVPKETCNLKFTQPRQVPKPLQTRWCLDPTPAVPGESYDENNALGSPLGQF